MVSFPRIFNFFKFTESLQLLLTIILVNWAVGILFVQYFYYRTRRLRNLDAAVKQKYAPFTNSPEKWNRLVHSLMSIFMIPRIIGFLASTIICTIAVWIVMLGSNSKAIGWRRTLIRTFSTIFGRIGLFFGSYIYISRQNDIIDYSPWLGEGWEKERPPVRAPIIISNHRTWSDVLLFMTTREFPSYVSSNHIRNLPFYGFLAKSYGSFFVQRGNKDSRNQTVFH